MEGGASCESLWMGRLVTRWRTVTLEGIIYLFICATQAEPYELWQGLGMEGPDASHGA